MLPFNFQLSTFFCVALIAAPFLRAEEALPFEAGEKLTYHFYWEGLMVGRGIFEVSKQESDQYILTVQVQSNKLISLLYPIDDVIKSFFDGKKLSSTHFIQNRNEGKHRTWEETFFYPDIGKASNQSYQTGDIQWFDIPKQKIQDKVSTIYYMRCLDWKERNHASVLLANDKGNYEVTVTKVGTESLKLDDFSPIPTFEVEPNTEYLSGFVKGGKLHAWVSNDRFKIPVKVVSRLSVGTVTAKLIKVEGVKDWPYEEKGKEVD